MATSKPSSRPCRRCGGVERYRSGHCAACARADQRRRYARERGRWLRRAAEYRATHPAERKAAIARWRAANAGRVAVTTAAWRAANPEKVRAYDKKWKSAHLEWERARGERRRLAPGHREAAKKRSDRWYEANVARHKAAGDAWRAANPERQRALQRASNAARLARLRGNPGHHTADDEAALYERWDHRCVYCGGWATTLDHIEPVSRGGSNGVENLVPACRPCNTSKCDRPLAEWLRRGKPH